MEELKTDTNSRKTKKRNETCDARP